MHCSSVAGMDLTRYQPQLLYRICIIQIIHRLRENTTLSALQASLPPSIAREIYLVQLRCQEDEEIYSWAGCFAILALQLLLIICMATLAFYFAYLGLLDRVSKFQDVLF
jgi:hypothetical protein